VKSVQPVKSVPPTVASTVASTVQPVQQPVASTVPPNVQKAPVRRKRPGVAVATNPSENTQRRVTRIGETINKNSLI
jgi:hypothetical protein